MSKAQTFNKRFILFVIRNVPSIGAVFICILFFTNWFAQFFRSLLTKAGYSTSLATQVNLACYITVFLILQFRELRHFSSLHFMRAGGLEIHTDCSNHQGYCVRFFQNLTPII